MAEITLVIDFFFFLLSEKNFPIFEEFIAATMEKNIYMKSEKLYMAFCMFDIDGSGKISAGELE